MKNKIPNVNRKRLADGNVTLGYSTFLGYDKGEDGNLKVNEEEAKVIKRIYMDYLNGSSYQMIANDLTKEKVKTPTRKSDKWNPNTIKSILTNEKYKGDALLQKYYSPDFLKRKSKVNKGEIPQYYIENNHEAIVNRSIWDAVQEKIMYRNNKYNIFTGKLVCAKCGSYFKQRTWHSTTNNKRKVWQCELKMKRKCTNKHLYPLYIEEEFMKELNKKIEIKDVLIKKIVETKDKIFDESNLKLELERLTNESLEIKKKIDEKLENNKKISQDQEIFKIEYDKLCEDFYSNAGEIEKVSREIGLKEDRKKRVETYIHFLKTQDKKLTEFKPIYWNLLLEKALINEDGSIDFKFIG